MQTLPGRAVRRVRAAAGQLFRHSLLLPMMVSFVCFMMAGRFPPEPIRFRSARPAGISGSRLRCR